MKEQTEAQIRETIAQVFAVNSDEIRAIKGDQEDFTSLLGANSIDILELLVSLEERFGFEFADHELSPDSVRSINVVTDMVIGKIS